MSSSFQMDEEYQELISDSMKLITIFLTLHILKGYVRGKSMKMDTSTFQSLMFLLIGLMAYHLVIADLITFVI